MVVHYPRTVWKNSYAAEHEVTGKTYNLKKNKKKHIIVTFTIISVIQSIIIVSFLAVDFALQTSEIVKIENLF